MHDPLSHQHSSRSDDRTYRNAPPSNNATIGDYRNPPPEYRISPPSPTYTYDTQVGPSGASPHSLEFVQFTRYLVSSTLPPPSSSASCGHEQSMLPPATTFQSQRGYGRLCTHTEPGDRRLSTSGIHSRPASLFDDGAVDEILTAQQDSSICRQYAMASCVSYSESVFVPTFPDVVGNFGACQPMYVCPFAFLHAAYYVIDLVGKVIGIQSMHPAQVLITQPFNLAIQSETT